jgi:4-aminobutyrate aminotransferase-like enzyme/Ser/Thr protein kinase RdoA (MazF antagonist)
MSPSGPPTAPDAAAARRALLEVWGDDADVESLPGDIDVNFGVVAEDGSRSILKFVAPETSDDELDLQQAALEHLTRRFSGDRSAPRIPSPLTTPDGRCLATFEGHRVRRLAWIDAPPLADVVPRHLLACDETDHFMRAIGRFMGRIDAALADFHHPAERREGSDVLKWNPSRVGWVGDHLGAVADPARRGMVERVLNAWMERVEPVANELPRSVIHADGHGHNLLVDPEDWAAGPVGVIDFGDMMGTARVCEPAVAATYAAMLSHDPVEAVSQVTAGWLEALGASAAEYDVPLARVDTDELRLIPTLVRARLAISVVVSSERAGRRPDDPYVTVSEAPAWSLLEALDHVAGDHVAHRILMACGRMPRTRRPADGNSARPEPVRTDRELLSERRRLTGPSLSLSYADPIHAVRGWMQYLYGADGTAYLDVYNNVPHVGHSHPRVAEAIARQTSLLATNTRYLSQLRLDYLERLAARFPDPLDTVFLVNSASEANELALRIVRAATGRRDLLVQEGGYHGHTTTLVDASPYKADGPGGEGTPDWVHTVGIPDPYRGRWRSGRDEDPGARYAADVREAVVRLEAEGRPPGAFLLETFPSVGGQIVPPAGYLEGAYSAIRDVGGLVIADEVQTGFGRLGAAEWGFETGSVVPDLVVLGKPMGNGFPLAAVVTTRDLAGAFDTGMEFFSTFGGNPVACAAGAAVLDVLDDEGLASNADRVGARLLAGLRALAGRHETIGDVRGRGLFTGVEFVSDRATRSPDAAAARAAVEGLKAARILAGTDGPDHNVLKLRGPLVLSTDDMDRVVEALDDVLSR